MSSAYAGGATMTWDEELMNIMGSTAIPHYAAVGAAEEEEKEDEGKAMDRKRASADGVHGEGAAAREEGVRDQVAGFLRATGELLTELGRGCWDIAQQSLVGAEDTYVGRKVKGHCAAVSRKLGFLNEFLPEDRDPAHAWPIVICVFLLALIVLGASSGYVFWSQPLRKLYISPPSASRIQLPDGRNMSYHEQGVAANDARFSMIAPHSFLSSRLAGIPGIRPSLLEEFGVRLITYDLPGFGESDPHPGRNLSSSSLDMHHLANALGILDKFWVAGYSDGGMHAWAALHHIPQRVAGVAMFAPVVNPYDSSLKKEERQRLWDKWTTKRKLMYVLARRFPFLLPYIYRRSFLSGRLGQLEEWLSLSLEKKDKSLLGEPTFIEFWEKNVAESVRQGDTRPFVEESVLQVSSWGFTLADLRVAKQPDGKGLLLWLKSLYKKAEHKQGGFLGPIHIWQGMDDDVMPSSTAEYIQRVLPDVMVHRLLDEGHFSYFCFCDHCHRQIFSTLFGVPQGPLGSSLEVEKVEGHDEEVTYVYQTEEE
ncbi:hypothetical protein Cni_G10639 [Canna indica]|uniref:AB hydrolase-1 domain-containing protein n=1 Tax=Canna indica TaxID=4628 RepID=A0AAQ3QAV3_9LILI|nr:hypothetical protein Cni_G10639 [Canna indica]